MLERESPTVLLNQTTLLGRPYEINGEELQVITLPLATGNLSLVSLQHSHLVLEEGLAPPIGRFSVCCVYRFHHPSICRHLAFAFSSVRLAELNRIFYATLDLKAEAVSHYNFVAFEVWFSRCQQTNYPLVGVTLFCALVRQAGLEPAMPSDA